MRVNLMIAITILSMTSTYLSAYSNSLSDQELNSIRVQSEATASTASGNIANIFSNSAKQRELKSLISENPDTIDQVPYKGTDLNNTPTLGNNLRESEGDKCDISSCNVSKIFSRKAMKERDAKLEEQIGITKDPETGAVIDNQGYLDKVKYLSKNAHKNLDFLTGTYTDCTPHKEEIISNSTEICDEFYDVKFPNCPVIQTVEIEPRYTYACKKKRTEKEKRCEEVLNLSCVEEEIVEKEANKLDFAKKFEDIAAKSGLAGACAKTRYPQQLLKAQVIFLMESGVCAENILPKLLKYWATVGGANCWINNVNVFINVHLRALGNWRELVKASCRKKICLKWQENYEKKCEYY